MLLYMVLYALLYMVIECWIWWKIHHIIHHCGWVFPAHGLQYLSYFILNNWVAYHQIVMTHCLYNPPFKKYKTHPRWVLNMCTSPSKLWFGGAVSYLVNEIISPLGLNPHYLSLVDSLYIYIYTYICVYVCIYIYIYHLYMHALVKGQWGCAILFIILLIIRVSISINHYNAVIIPRNISRICGTHLAPWPIWHIWAPPNASAALNVLPAEAGPCRANRGFPGQKLRISSVLVQVKKMDKNGVHPIISSINIIFLVGTSQSWNHQTSDV